MLHQKNILVNAYSSVQICPYINTKIHDFVKINKLYSEFGYSKF